MNEPLDQFPQTARHSWSFGKIVLGNLCIMLAYIVLGGVFFKSGAIALHLILIVVQVALNILAGLGALFSTRFRKTGLAFLLSGLLVAVIGPGMCGYRPDILRQEESRPEKPI